MVEIFVILQAILCKSKELSYGISNSSTIKINCKFKMGYFEAKIISKIIKLFGEYRPNPIFWY